MEKYQMLWNQVMYEVEKTYGNDVFTEIFSDLKNIHSYKDGYIYIIVKLEFNKYRINKFYNHAIDEIANKYSDEHVSFKFVSPEEVVGEKSLVSPEEKLESKWFGDINRTYTFSSFVVGKSNRFANTISMQVAAQPGVVANPLYIFGDVGLGKTHLMQAIGNYILDNDINKRVLYAKASSFVEDYYNLVNKGKMDVFNSKYRDIDVLLVDDIQILGGKEKTQMEFFKLFDILHDNHKQIVITSDKPADKLKDIMERLTSRFTWGLTVNVEIPDLEHRVEILKRKLLAETAKVDMIGTDVLEFIASYFVTNIRELEGALKRVMFYCIANNIDITIETAYEALEPLLKIKNITDKLNENNYDKIQSIVCDYYNISISDLVSTNRQLKYTQPRHIAMYLIKIKFNIPYKKIANIFNRKDHTTVMSACEKIENEMKINNQLKGAVDNLLKKLETT